MPQDLIRKEYTIREIKLNTRTNKADRIKGLRRYDELVNRGEGPTSASTMASGNIRRTKHCMFRLANVNFDRADLDDPQFSEKSLFWRDGTIVPHNAAKLEELWKELTSFFTDVLYLWYWTKVEILALVCLLSYLV
ncbi:uncharacterized protein PITG_16673 [Phytophthora infestans T30-4]|uniref:Uncharacterized protein n=1 Tax=Phytophthora infestans (strain T30-4) TaxID=403677 RepID=D0NVC4_PHYIT|nr:uncharacterized protein PITG_16673 [Phytophthora infestans T30-4]EEY66601.1 conserved hypothetical protein [Phytophthora infestans T30-4]|eukprot:XP_002896902.1 conserved hypothetical protein [Phytophthora infestans T30-4]